MFFPLFLFIFPLLGRGRPPFPHQPKGEEIAVELPQTKYRSIAESNPSKALKLPQSLTRRSEDFIGSHLFLPIWKKEKKKILFKIFDASFSNPPDKFGRAFAAPHIPHCKQDVETSLCGGDFSNGY